ncbi:Threonine/homoserine/homoserine lactone efflux protein [Aquimarina amphilecti]|uniref:Threonine/homoserine/homoserine lactone efflux protein n=1 Tax=Aquimarina amphilecti TaxID=1038014 RepID=A0A1H7QHJ6_AQUAM|nr:LysE family transporter [Aquimarina amphilecti]SEL47442.1 Threonine/homoserine/homoserine lactone efflux protein [Aquimarina amphilecti]
MSFIEGFFIGIAMIIFVGPVFFLLLNSSFQFGAKAGIAVALGIIISDIICVLLCYYGLSSFMKASQNQFWIGIIGSAILFGLGVNYLFKKATVTKNVSVNSKKWSTFFVKGFSVNFFNPFVFIVWIGVFKYGQEKYVDTIALLVFLIAVLTGILTTDLLKVFLSAKLKQFITPYRLNIFFKITGVILLIFSFRLVYLVW